jgi:lipid-A-disaccharide synthase
MRGPSILIVAGEASGDLHGSRLALELQQLRPDCQLKGIGGPKMEKAGVQLLYSLEDFAFLGFSEVLKHLPFIRRAFHRLKHLFLEDKPDLLILIDYPGFNLRLAKMAKQRSIPVFYYISPQVWAWYPRRAHTIARRVDKLAVILPFEVDFYRRRTGLRVHFVGHPLLEIVRSQLPRERFCRRWSLDPERPVLGLLPGSREQEIVRLLPIMLDAGRILCRKMPELQMAVGAASSVKGNLYQDLLRKHGVGAVLVTDQTYDLMSHARLLLVASGTATLESAILNTPMIVLYRVSLLSWLLALLLVRVNHIGLVNLVAGERIVPELVQHQVTASRVAREAYDLLKDDRRRAHIAGKLLTIQHRLGKKGASRRTAKLALSLIGREGD